MQINDVKKQQYTTIITMAHKNTKSTKVLFPASPYCSDVCYAV